MAWGRVMSDMRISNCALPLIAGSSPSAPPITNATSLHDGVALLAHASQRVLYAQAFALHHMGGVRQAAARRGFERFAIKLPLGRHALGVIGVSALCPCRHFLPDGDDVDSHKCCSLAEGQNKSPEMGLCA